MILSVFQDAHEVSTLDGLRPHLVKRFNEQFATFWLSSANGSSMALMIRGADAYIHFFPRKDHPGYQPEANTAGDERWVEFLADNYERTDIPRSLVIPTEKATAIFEEYFRTGAPSASIIWVEL